LLLLVVALLFAGLVALFYALMLVFSKRSVGLTSGSLAEAGTVAAMCWAIAFAAPFIAEAGSPAVDATMALTALSAFVIGVAVESRRLNPGWAGFFGAVLFAGAIWAVSFGIYAEFAWGWQGLRLQDLGDAEGNGETMLWMGAFFFAPTAALPGGLLGLLGSMTWRRVRTATA
jgi:hypothetical protein